MSHKCWWKRWQGLCISFSSSMLHFREDTERRENDCLSSPLNSQDMSFLMDFLIFVCEVIWYVSIRLWLAPHGAANRWSGCSCVNITLIHPFVFLLLLFLLLLSVTRKPLCQIFNPKKKSLSFRSSNLLLHHRTQTAWYLRHAPLSTFNPWTILFLFSSTSADFGPLKLHLSEQLKAGKTVLKRRKSRIVGA